MKTMAMMLVAGAMVLMGSTASAQQARAGGTGAPAPQGEGAGRTQEFNFTDELVQGQLVRPDGETTRVRRRNAGISLIRIREHFVPEMLKSVENI